MTNNIFDNPEFYRRLILNQENLLRYDLNKNNGKSLICVFFTAFCGVWCPFCFFHSPSYSQNMKKKESLENHFNKDGIQKFITFANEANVGYLQISGGGEPFLEKEAICECLEKVNAERIILITSWSWAYDIKKWEQYLEDLYHSILKREIPSRITIRLSVSEHHDVMLQGKPLRNLLNIFEKKYKEEKNITLQLKFFENDSALITTLEKYYKGYRLNLLSENGSDDNTYIKIIPRKYRLVLPSGYEVIAGKSRIFYSNLRPNLNNIENIKNSLEVFDKDLCLSQNNNSSIVYNLRGNDWLDWIVEYNGNVCTWQNRVQDNLLNIYEDDYKTTLKKTYQDVLTYSYIDKWELYRENIVKEVSPRSIMLMKAVNIRDYAWTLLFYDEKIRLYYSIRVIQDYLIEGFIDEITFEEFPQEIKDAVSMDVWKLKELYNNANYSILEQELKRPLNQDEFYDLLELIKLWHYDISEEETKKAINYYNLLYKSNLKTLDDVSFSKGLGVERRLTKRLMTRKNIKSEIWIKYFYFYRHWETDWNVENRIKGQLETIETCFTKSGLSQIEKIKKCLEKNNIEAIFSSDLARTRETSGLINDTLKLPLYYYKEFRWLNMWNFQGKSMQEFLSDKTVETAFLDHNVKIPGWESINNLIDRLLNGISIVYDCYNYDRVAIVSHGAAISNLKAHLMNHKYEDIDYCVIKVFGDKYEVTDYWKYESSKRENQSLFLVADIGWIQKVDWEKNATVFSEENQFLLNLKKHIKTYDKFVMVASDPTAYEKNDQFLQLDRQALTLSGLHFQEYLILDDRNKDRVKTVLDQASLVILAWGNTHQQNQFFSAIDLGKHLKAIDCPIVGISAGAMNCGEIVINSSEKSKNPDLPLILKGMGISQYTIVPHFEKKQKNPDEMKLIIQASQKTKIYALQDGSYLLNDTIYGRCDLIYQGEITRICDTWESFLLKK